MARPTTLIAALSAIMLSASAAHAAVAQTAETGGNSVSTWVVMIALFAFAGLMLGNTRRGAGTISRAQPLASRNAGASRAQPRSVA